MEEIMDWQKKTKAVAEYGMLIALACVLSYIEALIPLPLPTGVKLGLANLVALVALYTVGGRGAAVVSLVRIILVGLTFGNMGSMLYALTGGVLSLLIMILAKKTGWFSQVGISVLGGVFHNIGQLTVAALVTKTGGVFVYLPFLLVGGVVAGVLIGILGGIMVKRVEKIMAL